MTEFVNLDTAYDADTLKDWYISSVGPEPPVWTDEHIEELLNDFYVIPKDTPATDVAPVRHGRWVETIHKGYKCSLCNCLSSLFDENLKSEYCPWCGAKMDGGDLNGS